MRVWLSLLLVLQLAGFAGMGSAKANDGPDLSALSRALGVTVVLCHHAGDGQPAGPADRDCCACPLCHLLHHGFLVVPTAFAIEAPCHVRRAAAGVFPISIAIARPFVGAVGPRGPPLDL